MLILLDVHKEFSIQMSGYIRRRTKEKERKRTENQIKSIIRGIDLSARVSYHMLHVTFDEPKATVAFLNIYQCTTSSFRDLKYHYHRLLCFQTCREQFILSILKSYNFYSMKRLATLPTLIPHRIRQFAFYHPAFCFPLLHRRVQRRRTRCL